MKLLQSIQKTRKALSLRHQLSPPAYNMEQAQPQFTVDKQDTARKTHTMHDIRMLAKYAYGSGLKNER